MNREVIKISLSALFADLGYQGLISLFPLLVVVELGLPAYIYGIIEALSYGLGALFGFLGGVVSDRFGRKRITILGNTLMIFMSIAALPMSQILTPTLFILGWWMRNFRTPPRRAMLGEVSSGNELKLAFGILHALDIGGGVASVGIVVLLLNFGFSINLIYILSIPFFIISSIILLFVNAGNKKYFSNKFKLKIDSRVLILSISSSLFGITSFSFGFPILTIFTHSSSESLSVISYGMFLAVSALAGIFISLFKSTGTKTLALLGYGSSAIGSILLGSSSKIEMLYLGSALLGFSTGVVETLEPYLVTKFSTSQELGSSMGTVVGGRSIGLLLSNITMGVLFTINQLYAYLYAFSASISAALITLIILSKKS
jgi:MFS family permease